MWSRSARSFGTTYEKPHPPAPLPTGEGRTKFDNPLPLGEGPGRQTSVDRGGEAVKLVIGSDHAGYPLKARLADWLRSAAGGRHQVKDVGTSNLDSCDYPDFAEGVARTVK